jgi:hypothetical protein
MRIMQTQAAAIEHRRARYALLNRVYRCCNTWSKLGLYLLCLLILIGAPYPFQLASVISLAALWGALAVLSDRRKAFPERCRRRHF